MFLAGFETAIPASGWPQTLALDRCASLVGTSISCLSKMLRMFTSFPSYGILLVEMAHGTEEIATDRCPDLLETECASYVPTVTANCSMNSLSKETVFILMP